MPAAQHQRSAQLRRGGSAGGGANQGTTGTVIGSRCREEGGMILSYVIITRNRLDALVRTLAQLERNTDLPRGSWEAIVVDNASDDGSADEVARAFPDVRVIRLVEHEGTPPR